MQIREYLYMETDDACALCGCREARALTEHHIDGNKYNNAYDNRVILCYNCHQRHHDNNGDITADQIRDRKRRLITKTLTQYGVNALKLAARRGHVVAAPFLVSHLLDLKLLVQEAELHVMSSEGREDIEVSCQYVATEEGKRLVADWSL